MSRDDHADGRHHDLSLVLRLCRNWPVLSSDGLAEIMTGDCLYVNVPWPHRACHGPRETFDFLQKMQTRFRVDIEILTHVGQSGVVMMERLETFRELEGGAVVSALPVAGVFKLRDGKIAEWRDYFDSRQAKPIVQPRT